MNTQRLLINIMMIICLVSGLVGVLPVPEVLSASHDSPISSPEQLVVTRSTPPLTDDPPSASTDDPFTPPDSQSLIDDRKPSIEKPQLLSAAQAVITWEYDQIHTSVTYGSGLNEYLVVWEDHHWGYGNDWDIYGRRISSSGVPVGGAFGISWEGSNHRLAPDVAHNWPEQEYLVVWEYEYSSTDHDIYARRVNHDGILIGGEFAISSLSDYDRNPVIAYSPNQNSYLVVWERLVGNLEFGQYDIYAQRFGATGMFLGGSIALDTGTASQEHPAIAFNSSADEFLIVWQDKTAGNWDIMGRRLRASDGALLSGELTIESPGHNQTWPDIAYNNTHNEYLVVWEDQIGGSSANWDIKAWRRDASGGGIGWYLFSSAGPNRRMKPAVAYKNAADEYLVTYEYEFSASDLDVWQSRVRWDGMPRQTDGIVSNAWLVNEARPAVASDGAWSNLVVWEDWRNAGTKGIDIYSDLVKLYGLSGSVYYGYYPDTSNPVSGVNVGLYCSGFSDEWGTFLEGTATNDTGFFTLVDHGQCGYYNIGEFTPSGNQSTWASSIGGTVKSFDWIQFTWPLEGKTLNGNNFWDSMPPQWQIYLPLVMSDG